MSGGLISCHVGQYRYNRTQTTIIKPNITTRISMGGIGSYKPRAGNAKVYDIAVN